MNFIDEDELRGDDGLFDADGGSAPSYSSSHPSSSVRPTRAARKRRLDSDSDSSNNSDSDGAGNDSDAAPRRRQEKIQQAGVSDSDSDAAPRRKNCDNDTDSENDDDASPPRRGSNSATRKRQHQQSPRHKAPGFKGGLISGADFAKEQEVAKSRQHISSSSPAHERTGVVHRDRDGKIIDFEKTKNAREAAKKHEEYLWGTGKKQRETLLKKFEHIQKISNAPFSQFADDNDGMRDDALRNRMRLDDPMAKFEVSSDLSANTDGHDRARAKKIYRGPPAPVNRFGILPGYRWDGVNRGNGFEAKVMESLRKSKRKR